MIARYGSDGATTWTKTIVASDYASINGVAMLANGAALVTGELVGSTVFAPGLQPAHRLTNYRPATASVADSCERFRARGMIDG